MIKSIELRESDFRREVDKLIQHSPAIRLEFFEYWSELNKKGDKMRFEMEKTWDLGRRIARWSRNGFTKEFGEKKPPPKDKKDEHPMNVWLDYYEKNHLKMTQEQFTKLYDHMKENKLLRLSPEEVTMLKANYASRIDDGKRVAVKLIFEKMISNGSRF